MPEMTSAQEDTLRAIVAAPEASAGQEGPIAAAHVGSLLLAGLVQFGLKASRSTAPSIADATLTPTEAGLAWLRDHPA